MDQGRSLLRNGEGRHVQAMELWEDQARSVPKRQAWLEDSRKAPEPGKLSSSMEEEEEARGWGGMARRREDRSAAGLGPGALARDPHLPGSLLRFSPNGSEEGRGHLRGRAGQVPREAEGARAGRQGGPGSLLATLGQQNIWATMLTIGSLHGNEKRPPQTGEERAGSSGCLYQET